MDRAISLEARRIDLAIERPFQLGGVTVDPRAHEVSWQGELRRLQPQTLKVLVALNDKIGQVVTRDELIDRCWDGRFVGEDVVNRCISLLRRVSEQSAAFEIQTVPRGGYRLVELPARARSGHRNFVIGGFVLATLALLAAATLFFWGRKTDAPPTLSVLLVPFAIENENVHGTGLARDTQDSLTRMLTESGLSVKLAHDDADGKPKEGTGLVVSGMIGGNQQGLLATVQVEDAHRHEIILSHQLNSDFQHAADLPDQIAANVAGSLSWAVRLIQLDRKRPSDPAVISHLLDTFSTENLDFWRTYEFARRNAPSAPNSAIAQWELAMDTGLLIHGLPNEQRPAAIAAAVSASDRALTLDPEIGDFYIPWCLLHPIVRLLECEDHLREGLKIDPRAAWVQTFLGHQMNNVGRTQDAMFLDATSLEEDVDAPAKIAQALMMFEAAGASQQAQALYQRGVHLWPHLDFLFLMRVKGITERGDFNALYRLEQKANRGGLVNYDSGLALAKAVKDRSLPGVKASCPKTSIDFRIVQCMLAFGELGDLEDAFAYANEVYPERRGRTLADEQRLWFADPFLLDTAFLTGRGAAPLRRDPRYLNLAARLGLLDYWHSGRLPDFCTRSHEPICTRI